MKARHLDGKFSSLQILLRWLVSYSESRAETGSVDSLGGDPEGPGRETCWLWIHWPRTRTQCPEAGCSSPVCAVAVVSIERTCRHRNKGGKPAMISKLKYCLLFSKPPQAHITLSIINTVLRISIPESTMYLGYHWLKFKYALFRPVLSPTNCCLKGINLSNEILRHSP